jgi:hypothetical protein
MTMKITGFFPGQAHDRQRACCWTSSTPDNTEIYEGSSAHAIPTTSRIFAPFPGRWLPGFGICSSPCDPHDRQRMPSSKPVMIHPSDLPAPAVTAGL